MLSRLTKYLPSRYKEISKHFSYVFSLRIAQQAIGFISFFIIIQHVSKEVIGHYNFVLSVIGLVSITSLPGMRVALVQSIARGKGAFFKVANKYCFLGSGIGSLILLAISGYYFIFGNSHIMALTFIISAVLFPFSRGLVLWKTSLSGSEEFKTLSIMEIINALILNIVLVASAFVHTQTPIALLTIALLIPSLQNIFLSAFEYKKYQDQTDIEDGMLKYGLKTSTYQISTIASNEVDKISIYSVMSPAELAVYSVAMKIPEAFKMTLRNLSAVITPKMARIPTYSKNLDRYFTMVSVGLLAVIIVFSFTIFDDLFYWITPEEYHHGLPYSQALLLTFAVGNFGFLKSKYVYSQKNIESNKKITLMSTMIKIILTPFLVFFFHIWGAITAIFLQRLFMSVYVNFVVKKHHIDSKEH